MSIEIAKAFYNKAAADKNVQTKIRMLSETNASTKDKLGDLVAIAHEAGFALSPTDIVSYSKLEAETEHAAKDKPEALLDNEPHTCFWTDCGTNICTNV